ncbi:MAG: hypothetical protein JWR33_1859 [Naasia sp.]|nr:hypothetical protein [Naasia sp.]
MTERSTREVIEAIFADAEAGDVDAVLRWWADDGVLEDVTIGRAFTGKSELRPYLNWYFAALPEVRYVPIRMLVDGLDAVVEWCQTSPVVGEFDGVAPSGQILELHAIDVFHVENGLIVHESSWYGDGWFRQRLHGMPGLTPALPVTPPLQANGTRFGSA